MSVAFRRESDDEHLEPTFELPIPAGPNYVTARGLAQISAKLADLTAHLDSLTNESDIKATKRALRYWNTRQSTAQLLEKPDGTRVAFGCTVDYVQNGKPHEPHQTSTIVCKKEAWVPSAQKGGCHPGGV
jgi:transcription elongation GreA/GreB family factor